MIIILTFIAFTGLVALISWYKTKEENLSTKEGYFLAGRGLTGLVIAGSLEMTNLSTEQLVGQAGQSYSTNMGAMSWSVNASIALLALALIFLPKYLKAGITTIPEFLEVRFDRTTKQIISFLFLLGYMLTYLPTVLYSGALAFNQIFHLDQLFGITTYQSIAILCVAIGVIGSIYAIFGGLKAVAVSDTVNGVGLLIGGLLIPILSICILGNGSFLAGIQDFITNVPAEKFNAVNPANALPPMIPWPVLFLGMLFNNLFYWCTNQSIIQRTFGAKNLKEAQKGAVFAGFLKIMTPLIIVVPGVICALAYPGMDWGSGDSAYPMLVAEVMPKPILGFFAAVMFGAILSSFNSVLNSASTIYALDIHRPLFNPTASDARMVKIGQNFGTVVAVVSTIMSPFMLYMGGITSFVNSAFAAFNTPIFVCLLCGFFWKKVPAIAAKIVIPVHVVLYFILQFGLRNVIPALNNIHYLYFTAILFVFDMLLMWVIVKKHPRATDFELKDVGAVDLTPWKNGKIWATVTLLIMVLAYVIFSPLGFGKSEKTTYQNYLENQTTASVSDSVQ